MKKLLCFSGLFLSMAFAGPAIDIKQLPFVSEVNIVAIDIQVNPTTMPDQMLWDNPILLVYRQVDSLDNLRIDSLREEITDEFKNGDYRPVVLRTRQGGDLRIHFMNAIGLGNAPIRLVQGRVCKGCKAMKAYTFSYSEGAEESQFPYYASIHAHGVNYTIENDGTNAGLNPARSPRANSIVAPGEVREYYYRKLDTPGLWPFHDHANTAHSVSRGLHMALVVEPHGRSLPDRDFVIIFSDYPDFEQYEDEFYGQTFIPPFLHMKTAFVMHAHALNGYAAMMVPRMGKAVASGGTKWDALRSDIVGDPNTPVFEAQLGELVRFRLLSFGTQTTHSFHVHGHVWWDRGEQRFVDNVAIPAGGSKDVLFYAGGPAYRADRSFKRGGVRSGAGDWLYHCHVIPHVKHGMWGIFRVTDPNEQDPE